MPILNASRRKNRRNFFSLLAALSLWAPLALIPISPAAAKKTGLHLSAAFVPAAKPSARKIRVGVVINADQIRLSCKGRCTFDDASGKLYYLVPGKNYLVRAMQISFNLKLGGLQIGPTTTIKTEALTDCAFLNGRCYRGQLVLQRNSDDTVTAVDVLDIEDYLMGVLPNEMDPGWPLEALKAQAVVARTFAYTQLDKYESLGYDLTDDTRSQVFGDLDRVASNVRKAVNATSGEVLGYNGKILEVYYHACCGGHTADKAEIWGGPEPPPPLRGVRDPYCRDTPFYRWTVYVPLAKVIEALEPGNLLAGPLDSLRISGENWDGYVQNFIANINGNRLKISAGQFRHRLGASLLKSDRIYHVRLLADEVEFDGHGLGHGVGLCQWGAHEQAKLGRSYERILKFYFPGSYIAVVDE